jgi:hypothetical protein
MWPAGFSQRISIRDLDRPVRPGSPLLAIAKTCSGRWTCFDANRRYYDVLVFEVLDRFTRRIVGFAVHSVVDGVTLCRMSNRVIHAQGRPKYLSSDRDPLYRFHQWQANLRVLEIPEIKTVFCVPLAHPFLERPIGTIRREYLDQPLLLDSG